ncbi:MAG: capsule biosynthesis GfcC family protein, partial [Vibrio sp.]
PDTTRVDADMNPLITGKWILNLQTHTNSVLVLGNVKHMGEQPWQQRQDALTYAHSAGLLTSPLSELTVIQPDGQVETHPVAYWNRDFHEVSPGAIVYVPMPHAHAWFAVEKSNVSTNRVIVDLLRNRLP